jgi:GNAT superfamily N-acetyltransferase
MNVVLRQAMPSDALGVADVYLASRKTFLPFAPLAHSDAEVRQWVADVLIPSGSVTVATTIHEPIGMMALSRDGQLDWIDQLYLHPSAVGRGIGTQLLERAKEELGSRIRLYTFQASTASRRFYERHGFRSIAFSDGHANEEHCPDVLYELDRRASPCSATNPALALRLAPSLPRAGSLSLGR